jgi:hypothetical protein
MDSLKELKEWNDKLTSLLNDPHPGLVTWKIQLADILTEIAKFAPVNEKNKDCDVYKQCTPMRENDCGSAGDWRWLNKKIVNESLWGIREPDGGTSQNHAFCRNGAVWNASANYPMSGFICEWE